MLLGVDILVVIMREAGSYDQRPIDAPSPVLMVDTPPHNR